MEKVSRRHHFVPKSILKRFASSREQVYYFEKSQYTPLFEIRNIRTVFYEKDYYNLSDETGRRSDIVERSHFGAIDNAVSVFIDQVEDNVRRRTIPNLHETAMVFLRNFIYSYQKRMPDSLREIPYQQNPRLLVEENLGNIPDRFLPLSPEETNQLLSDESVRRISQYARVLAQVRHSPEISHVMSTMKPVFALCRDGKSFVIGSRPVLRFENKKGAILGDGVELWTPLTSRIYVGLVDGSATIAPLLVLNDFWVRCLNERQFTVSSAIASSSLKLMESLTRRKYTGSKILIE